MQRLEVSCAVRPLIKIAPQLYVSVFPGIKWIVPEVMNNEPFEDGQSRKK